MNRVARETTPTAKVLLPLDRASGIRAVGPYKPGVEVDVPVEEARRLVDVKGFVYVGGMASDSTDAAPAATTED